MIERSRIRAIHFVGIGGAGMSGIAEVLHNLGFGVTGSDLAENDMVRHLRGLGITIFIGHRRENLGAAEVLVYSSAVRPENEEVAEALARKIPVIPRAEMLAELMRMKFSICIAGTHGKTTTTSMIAAILSAARLDPTFVIGGKLASGGAGAAAGGAKLGYSQYLVAEADESDGSFLKLLPVVAVITNIENDHLDFYGSLRRLRGAFLDFAQKVPFYGAVVANADCPNVRRIDSHIRKRIISYAIRREADYRAVRVRAAAFHCSYDLIIRGTASGPIELQVGGRHNVGNSLAAIAAAQAIDIPLSTIRESLRTFRLPQRRFQVLYDDNERLVIDDYAHHPTEIKATLRTLRSRPGGGRIIALFQPHRFTRLQSLMKQFATAFKGVDKVVVTKLYAANQPEIENVNGRVLAEKIRAADRSTDVVYLEGDENICGYLQTENRPGDAIVFLSAGNLTQLAHRFADDLKRGKA